MVKKNTLSSLDHLKDLSIAPGAVFIGPWDGIDHEKYLIVAAVNPERILVCSVMINSQVNHYIMNRPKMLAGQLKLKVTDYDFLKHDSFANCAQPIKASFEHFMKESVRYCGLLNEADLAIVRQLILASGMLTIDDIRQFFGEEANESTDMA